MEVTLTIWIVTILGITGLILLDFVAVSRKPHEVMFKEALLWSIFYIGIAIAFGTAWPMMRPVANEFPLRAPSRLGTWM